MRKPFDAVIPDPTALAAWRAELAQARRNPWLASLIMTRLSALRLRFAAQGLRRA